MYGKEVIARSKRKGAVILLASHNKEDLNILADYIVKMKDGTIEFVQKGDKL